MLLPEDRLTARRAGSWRSCTPPGIGTGVHYPAIHLFALYRRLGWKDGDFPHAEYAGRNLLTLPLFPAMTRSDVTRVVRALAAILENPPQSMSAVPDISVVIPVYNEEPNLPLLFSQALPGAGRARPHVRGDLHERRERRPLARAPEGAVRGAARA